MPLYDYECPCGRRHEAIRSFARKYDALPCPCGQEAKAIVGPVTTVGIVWSNGIVVGNGDRVVTSNAELRAYEKEAGGRHVDTKSAEWRKIKDRAYEAATVAAKKRGYSSPEECREKVVADYETRQKDAATRMV